MFNIDNIIISVNRIKSNSLPVMVSNSILPRDLMEVEDLIKIRSICKRWKERSEHFLKDVLFINCFIEDEVAFVNRLLGSGKIFQVKEIYYVGQGGGSYRGRVPLQSNQLAQRLLQACVNVHTITFKNVDPFKFLGVIENCKNSLRLKHINVDWSTCRASDAIKRKYYGVSLLFKDTITKLNVNPDDQEFDLIVYNCGILRANTSVDTFLGFFKNLQ